MCYLRNTISNFQDFMTTPNTHKSIDEQWQDTIAVLEQSTVKLKQLKQIQEKEISWYEGRLYQLEKLQQRIV